MKHNLKRNHIFYGVVIIVGLCVVISFVLWFRLELLESTKDVESVIEHTLEGEAVTTGEVSSAMTTPVLVMTEESSSSVNEAIFQTEIVNAPIYILAEDSETMVEVWQFLPKDDQWTRLYTISRPIDKPDKLIIPDQEMERMNNYLATQSPSLQLPTSSIFKSYIRYLVLSPTINQLAFVEWYSYFADESQQGHFGVKHTGSLILETSQSQNFFQSPVQSLIDEIYYFTSLHKPLWSPDAQYYSIEYEVTHFETTPLVINVTTGTVQQLESSADLSGPLAWSPDSTTVFLYLYRSGFDSSGGIIRLCEVEPVNCRDIELDEIWVDTWGADWSPQRDQIVVVGAKEDINWASTPPSFSLYLFDPETEVVSEITDNFNRSLRVPRWSPDGKLIAVEYNPKDETDFPNTIVIVDSDAGQTIAEIPVEGCFGEWQWKQNSQSILQLPCFKTETNNSLKIYDVFDGSRQQIELPVEIGLKNRLGFDTLSLP